MPVEPPESVEDAEERGLGEAPEYHDGSCDEECREHDHLPVTEESSPVHNFCFGGLSMSLISKPAL